MLNKKSSHVSVMSSAEDREHKGTKRVFIPYKFVHMHHLEYFKINHEFHRKPKQSYLGQGGINLMSV